MKETGVCEQIERLLAFFASWMESGELQELRVTGDGSVFVYGAETVKAETAFGETDRDRLTRLVAAYFEAEIHAGAPDLSVAPLPLFGRKSVGSTPEPSSAGHRELARELSPIVCPEGRALSSAALARALMAIRSSKWHVLRTEGKVPRPIRTICRDRWRRAAVGLAAKKPRGRR